MPVLGKLSDPYAILSWKRSTNFFYAYYALKILTVMITEGGVICLALAYLADNVPEERRISAFGVLFSVTSADNVSATLAARLLSTPHIFQVATAVSVVSVIYVSLFLKETSQRVCADDQLQQPILKGETEENGAVASESSEKITFITKIPSPKDTLNLLTSSVTFSLLAGVSFFNSLSEAGIQSFLYFVKARFHFNKDQFADILFITYVGSTVCSMLLVPVLSLFIRDETLLIVGLFAGFLNMFFNSIAWSAWVPSASASLGLIFNMANPNLKSLASKQTGPNEQGIAQGSIFAIASFAYLVSPIIYSPLSALFLSEGAPFHFPGFSIFCVGLAYLIAFIPSIFIKSHISSRNRM